MTVNQYPTEQLKTTLLQDQSWNQVTARAEPSNNEIKKPFYYPVAW